MAHKTSRETVNIKRRQTDRQTYEHTLYRRSKPKKLFTHLTYAASKRRITVTINLFHVEQPWNCVQ